MSTGKIIGIVIAGVVLLSGGIGAGLYFGKDKKEVPAAQSAAETSSENSPKAPAPAAKTPTPLPIEYTGNGNFESEIFTLAEGALSFSANLGVDPGSIDSGSGGYAYIGVRLINVDGKSFPGVDEYNSGEDGALSLGETINKSDGQSSYSLSERVNVTAGDYKIEVKGGPSGLGPNLTGWKVRFY